MQLAHSKKKQTIKSVAQYFFCLLILLFIILCILREIECVESIVCVQITILNQHNYLAELIEMYKFLAQVKVKILV